MFIVDIIPSRVHRHLRLIHRYLYHFTDHFGRTKGRFLFNLLFVLMGAVFCGRSMFTLALEQEKGLGMIQLKTIELFLHVRIEKVYTGMVLDDNANVV